MKILDKKNYSHIFFEDENETYLYVLCGGAGVFEMTIKLTPAERDQFIRDSQTILDFVSDVNSRPENFRNRVTSKQFDFSGGV